MNKNHFAIALRNFRKRKAFTFINTLGLTVGMTVCLLILAYAKYEMSFDNFHPNSQLIYRTSVDIYNGDVLQDRDAQCYPALGGLAVEEFPEIENYGMVRHIGRILFKNENVAFNEDRVYFANPGWLEIFDWQVIKGNPEEALTQADKVILTETIAKKYFGDEDPLGKKLSLVPGGGEVEMVVSAIIKDVPENTHLSFDILVSWESGVKYLGWELENWNGNNEFVYLLANQPLSDDFDERLNASIDKRVEADREELIVTQPLTDIHLYSDRSYEAEANGDYKIVQILLLVAGFVLLVAWVNYINLATAKSLERAKEVGVRKVLGSSKSELVFQFLTESFLINFLALVLTFTLLQAVLPIFNQFSGLSLSINPLADTQLLWQVLTLYFVGSFASGLYPAFILSNYKPLVVLRGKMRDSKKGSLLRRSLVVFQFLITMLLLVGTMTIYQQVNYMRTLKLGFDKEQVLVLRTPLLPDGDDVISMKLNSLRNELNQLPEIKNVAFSETMMGNGTIDLNSTTGLESLENNVGGNLNFYMYRVDSAYFNTLGIEVLAGRNFDNSLDAQAYAKDSPLNHGLILNETGRKLLGYETNEAAIGSPVKLNWERKIIGVISDYNHNSLKTDVDPMFIMFDKNLSSAQYVSIKLEGASDNYSALIEKVERTYRDIYSESDFEYYFLDDKFNQLYNADQQFGVIFTSFSVITIFVAILGLFGLVLYEVQQRVKEIGIRKVLGASVNSIVRLFSINFLKLIGLSILISSPLAFLGMEEWLSSYAYRISFSIEYLIIPAVVLVIIALATISIQALRVAHSNPIESLRNE